eukprot:gene8198-9076_t
MALLSEEEEARIIKERDYSFTLEDEDELGEIIKDLELSEKIEDSNSGDADCNGNVFRNENDVTDSGSVNWKKELDAILASDIAQDDPTENKVNEKIDKKKHEKNGKENENENNSASKNKRSRGKEMKRSKTTEHCMDLADFFLQLLSNEAYTSFIFWTNKERKEFKLANPRQIANHWGQIKCKRKFTAENLTREIRKFRRKGRIEKLLRQDYYKFVT